MARLRGRNKGASALAIVLLVAGCGTLPARGQPAAQPPAASGSSAASGRPPASGSQAAAAIWLDSLQMTSASTGWALRWTQSPAVADNGYLAPAHTTDGARTWTSVTPRAARALLATPGAAAVLQALDGERAWLAVTAATTGSSSPYLTVVFGTSDGGRTWTESAPFKVPGYARLLSFADPGDGWLLANYGGTMGQDPVRLYRNTDAGLHWSLVAATPQSGTGSNGLPVQCDKAGLAFATAQAGWLTSYCTGESPDVLLVTRDGGARWAPQPLPVPASAFCSSGCEVYNPPQFFGRTAFVVIGHRPAAPYFLTSHDLGQTWKPEPLPSGAGLYPRITFFSPLSGMLVSAGPQGVIGHVFYTTANGGRTWTPVPQGRFFTQPGTSFDFVSPRTGFAWAPGADAKGPSPPAMYLTTDSGRTWVSFTPRLAAA